MTDSERHTHFGESGLTHEDFEEFIVKPECADDVQTTIIAAVMKLGFEPDITQSALFRKYYRMVSDGPGKTWTPARRAAFALQTMNRMGVIEWPKSAGGPKDEPAHEVRPPAPAPQEDGAKVLFGYRRLSPSEIKDNLTVAAAVLGVVLLAAGGVVLGVVLGSPGTAAGTGGIAVAAFCAVAARLGRRWHTRFTRRYNIARLLVCLALLFSGAAWLAAKDTWSALSSSLGAEIPICTFGLSLFGLMTLMAVGAHIKLCRTDDPRTAKTLGWIEALSVVFAIGSFLFIAINKP